MSIGISLPVAQLNDISRVLVLFRGNYESNRSFGHPNRNRLLITDLYTLGVYQSHLANPEIMF